MPLIVVEKKVGAKPRIIINNFNKILIDILIYIKWEIYGCLNNRAKDYLKLNKYVNSCMEGLKHLELSIKTIFLQSTNTRKK
jgi:hypothetical protein